MDYLKWIVVGIFSVIILIAIVRYEYKRKLEKQTDLQKTEALWWKLQDDPATRNSEVHRTIGEKLDKMLLTELEKALRVVRTTSRLISLDTFSDEDRQNRRKSQDTLEAIFRSWYDHRPKIRKFFDNRKGIRVIQRIFRTFSN